MGSGLSMPGTTRNYPDPVERNTQHLPEISYSSNLAGDTRKGSEN
jgi:hypothetical protein